MRREDVIFPRKVSHLLESAPVRPEGGAAREREEAPVVVEAASIPEVQYQSEVKVEDLPF